MPREASAMAEKPQTTPKSWTNWREVSTMRASIMTCGVSVSSVPSRASMGSTLLGMSLTMRVLVRSSMMTFPRGESTPPSRTTRSTSLALA